jgi:hypothetical protein
MGLLSLELEKVRAFVRSKYKSDVAVVEEIINRAVKLQHELQIHKDSERELLVALLYIRTLLYVQSAVLLIERGLDPPARVLLRASLEALFYLGAVAKDSSFRRDYVNADRAATVRLANKLTKLEDPAIREKVVDVVTPEWMAAAKAARDEVKAKTPCVEQAAKAAGYEELYNSAYTRFSACVHSTVRDLEEHHLTSDEQGTLQAGKAEPTTEGLRLLYMAAAEILLEAVQVTARVFEIPIEQFCVAAKSKLKELTIENVG